MKKLAGITYNQSGVNYESLDPAKKLAQTAAKETAKNLKNNGMEEISETRGEAAFVWSLGKDQEVLMASVIESLGTKNLVADAMRKIADPEQGRRTYYDVIGHDTIAAIVNDLVTVGAKPLVIHAFWAVGKSEWFDDLERAKDLVDGWKSACDLAGATWGGGETPSYNDIVNPAVIGLGGSAVGIVTNKKQLLLDTKLQAGDRIVFLKSTGINANGLSLARAVAKKLPEGYATKLSDGTMYGEALLTKTNIYAKVIRSLLADGVDVHYISNITGHGVRKIMRARENWTYIIEKLFTPPTLFSFIQKHASIDEYEMYQTYNMGQDYALFIPEKDVKRAQEIIKICGFESLDAGYIEKGQKQVILKSKNLTYKGETLDLR